MTGENAVEWSAKAEIRQKLVNSTCNATPSDVQNAASLLQADVVF